MAVEKPLPRRPSRHAAQVEDAVTRSSRRSGAVDKAVQHLQRLVDMRRVLPGEALPAAAVVGREIGVNRVAVLQAMQLLQRDGLVVVRPGRGGARVIGRDDRPEEQRLARAIARRERMKEAAPLREILESGIARLVATKGLSDEAAGRAKELVRAMRETRNRDEFHALDNQFHELLGEAAGSKILEALATALRQDVLVGLDAFDLTHERLMRSNHEHDKMLSAILRRSSAAAADLAHRHASGTTALLAGGLDVDLGGMDGDEG